MLKKAAESGQELGKRITSLDLKHGAFTMILDDPYQSEEER
jgi:hypothetical protein